MSLREKFLRLISEYRNVFDEVWRTGIFKNNFGSFVRHDIADELGAIASGYNSVYISKGSVGQTKWTPVPWMAIFDTRITRKATEKEYIVYLFNSETKDLYLTFNQAAAEKNNAAIRTFLKENALKIRSKMSFPTHVKTDDIYSGNAAYDAGCICYIKYTADNMPSDEKLKDDLIVFLDIYKEYYDLFYAGQNNWWPSLEEYTPGFTKEQWGDILSKPEIVGPVWGGVLAMFYTEPNGATCKMLAEKFNDSPYSISGKCTQLAKKIHSETKCPLFVDDNDDQEKHSYWPILFQGRDVKGDESGTWVWKLRSELYEALTEFGVEKYLPDVSKFGKFDSWEIVDENTAIKTCDKSFFEHNGSGVPKGICWFFDAEDIPNGASKEVTLIFNGITYIGKLRNDTTDRRRIQILWNADLGRCLEVYREPNVTATFKRITEKTFEITMSKEGEKMTIKEKVSAIKNYIASKGFNYEGNLIENFYLSLKSKPFVILAGTSGTGKTRLVKLFAEAINAKMLLVPVRPDWSDSSDLFGHVDLSGEFNPGAILEFIKEAQDNIDKPYILCLDEMNLARVEYYFSDFLSIIETRENVEGKIVSDPLVDEKYYKKDTAAAEKYGKIIIPENLYIIGTVNMDETTFPFSKKVLDRANTIEFSFVDLMAKPSVNSEALPKALNEENSFLKTEYLFFNEIEYEDFVKNICGVLADVNDILSTANLHVGYRVRDEIVFYMMNNKNAELLEKDAAFDNQIMQKILPRIQGSSTSIRKVLINLFKKCGYFDGLDDTNSTYDDLYKCIKSKDCKYPNSANKIAFMVRRFDEDGFTSYWL